jgi:beta-glucanase (GH16 family)
VALDDDFTHLDPAVWEVVDDTHGRDELQWYEPGQVTADGQLHLRAERRQHTTRDGRTYPFVSGMVRTWHRVTFTYGTVEIAARMPRGQGWWGGAWLLPEDGSWPPEVDMFESFGGPEVMFNVHWGAWPTNQQDSRKYPVSDDVHVYRLVWSRKSLRWYLDGELMRTVTRAAAIPKVPMYLILNLAVRPDPGMDAAEMTVDYVRIEGQHSD